MKRIILLVALSFSVQAWTQIKGTVREANGNPLPFVSIFLENSYRGTTSNDQGQYELALNNPGKYTIVFQYLGFRTKKVSVNAQLFPHELNVVLDEENITLQEVVINPKINPANAIIRSAIAARKQNSEKTAKYTADFYSRGIFRIKDAPKKVLGKKIDMFDEVLDSTRSGILYLSETVSKLTYQKPDKLKEVIIASKVSGNDNGFSFNNAASVNFDLYENYLPFEVNVISPIASNAFNYYKYSLEGTFFDDNEQLINKIRVTPKRDTEPAMDGYIYIVDDSWAIYAADLSVKGNQIQIPAVKLMTLKQNFNYNPTSRLWVKNMQVLDFEAGILGINISGRFTYVYSNFEFPEAFAKRTFTSEVLSFEKDANKKDENYWDKFRPVPLTLEESRDYEKKDKLQEKKKSRAYLDSVDRKKNKFRPMDIVSGYSYQNSFRNETYTYDGILSTIGFNTVQGYHFATGFSYTKRNPDLKTYTSVGTRMNYGIAEDRFRATGFVTRKFNNTTDRQLTLSGGSSIDQFNPSNPITRTINSMATSFFRRNYMKLFDRTFLRLAFQEEILNGVQLSTWIDYSRRKQLFNNTDESIIRNDQGYTSNNPLAPNDFSTPFFETHHLVKSQTTFRLDFGQQYWSRPDGKIRIRNTVYPTLFLTYEKGFAGSEKKYNYDFAQARLAYDIDLGNKGTLGMNVRAGQFFNADEIAFVDYKHFNGNRTHIGQSERYLNVFNQLPYYTASTNDRFVESHFEHDDSGFVTNKIPLLNRLHSTLVIGYHNLVVPERRPYSEYTIGFDNLGIGKVKIFRIDYIRSYSGNAFIEDGVVFGLKFLNVLD